MNLTHALTILIQAKNAAGPALSGTAKAIQTIISLGGKLGPVFSGAGAAAGSALNGLLTVLKMILRVTGFVAAGVGAVTAAFVTATAAASTYAAELEVARNAFNGIAEDSAPKMLQALRENSAFMLTDLTIQRQYVEAYMLTGRVLADRLPEAYRHLSKVALATGDDVDYITTRLYRSVGRLSTRWMAYIGTVVEMEEATAHAVDMFGVQEDALSRAQIQAAMFDRVMEKLAARTARMPEITGTAKQMLMAFGATVQNLAGNFGTIFLPAAQAVLRVLIRLGNIFNILITEGGGLYNFFRTIAAAVTVAFEAIDSLLMKFFDLEDQINNRLDALGQSILRKAWQAFSWGVQIATQLAAGLIKGAAQAITAAMNFISNMLTFWLRPSSPPRVAPLLDKWGMETMEVWLEGFTNASFDVLEGVQGKLESVLSALVDAEALGKAEAAEIFLQVSEDLIEGLSVLAEGGTVLESMFENLMGSTGMFGTHLGRLLDKQLAVYSATIRLTRATKELKAAQQELEDSGKELLEATDQYYLGLVTGASYSELVARRERKRTAEERRRQAKERFSAAEKEKKAAEQGLEGLRDRLSLQERIIDQLTLLLRKRQELIEDSEGAGGGGGGGGGGAGGGGGGAGFELPKIEMPDLAGGAGIDQAFEDLKDKIRDKFETLWDDVKQSWEESGVYQAIEDLKKSWSELKTAWGETQSWFEQAKVDTSTFFEDLAETISKSEFGETIRDEFEEWGSWWKEESPAIAGLVETLGEYLGDFWGQVNPFSPDKREEVYAYFDAYRQIREEKMLERLDMFAGILKKISDASLEKTTRKLDLLREALSLLIDTIRGDKAGSYGHFWNIVEMGFEGMGDSSEVAEGRVSTLQSTFEGLGSLFQTNPNFIAAGNDFEEAWVTGLETAKRELEEFFGPLKEAGAELWGEENPLQKFWQDFKAPENFLGPETETTSTFFEGLSDWLVEKIPGNLETFEGSWQTTWVKAPAMLGTAGIGIFKIFGRVSTWLSDTLTKDSEGFESTWDTMTSNMKSNLSTSWTTISEIFGNVVTWLSETGPTNLFNFETVWATTWIDGIKADLVEADLDFQGIWNNWITYWTETLPGDLTSLKSTFSTQLGLMKEAVGGVKTKWDSLTQAISRFWDWLKGKTFRIKVKTPKLPDEWTPKSPLPIHTALENFYNYLDSHRAAIDVTTPDVGTDTVMGMMNDRREASRQGNVYYIEKVVLENVDNPDDLLRQLERQANAYG